MSTDDKLSRRRAIFQAVASLPFIMSLGGAISYFEKKKPRPFLTIPYGDACAKIDDSVFNQSWSNHSFAVKSTDGSKEIAAIAVKLPDGRIVAYPASCPRLNCDFHLLSERSDIQRHFAYASENPVLGCKCHKSVFDVASGEVLSGPQRASLNSFKVKQCHQKVCVIVDNANFYA